MAKDLVEEALEAFELDPGYIIEMAHSAALIAYKRALWSIRTKVTETSRTAASLCRLDTGQDFLCTNDSPCGFGRCAFATPPTAAIKAPQSKGSSHRRPAKATQPTYTVEGLISVLAQKEGIHIPPPMKRQPRSPEPQE